MMKRRGGGGSPDDIVSSLQGVRALLTHPIDAVVIANFCKLDLLPGLLTQVAHADEEVEVEEDQVERSS